MADKETYSGVHCAYDFVFPQYEWSLQRFESLDGRLQSLTALIAVVTFGVLAATANHSLSYHSPWFLLALAFGGGSLAVGVGARMMGKLRLVDTGRLYKQWLHKDEWTFKKDLIYFSGSHLQENQQAIQRKWCWAIIAFVGFLVELGLFSLWILL